VRGRRGVAAWFGRRRKKGGKKEGQKKKEKREKKKKKKKRKRKIEKKENKARKIEKGFRKLGEFLGKLGEGFLRIFPGFSNTGVKSGTVVIARWTGRRDRGGAGFPSWWPTAALGRHAWVMARVQAVPAGFAARAPWEKNRPGFRKGVK
jgi:hypothetical protein